MLYTKEMMRHILSVWVGKSLLILMRIKGGGSALPGLVVERLDSAFLSRYKGGFEQVILVAGTNGKTTTTKMLRQILTGDDHKVLTNAAGSNMPRGVISALLAHVDWLGRSEADTALLEVDEGFLGSIAEDLNPDVIVVLNLLRDQLDRYGELDRTARLIEEALPMAKYAVLNADDPRVAALHESAAHTIWFGANKTVRALLPHDDALHDKGNGASESLSDIHLSVEVVATEDSKSGQTATFRFGPSEHRLELQISGAFNAYNAAAALAAGSILGVPTGQMLEQLYLVEPAFGRSERIKIGDKTAIMLLVKNPSGFNQIVHTYLANAPGSTVLIGINDNYADGRDVSWLWDVDIERLEDTNHTYLTTGSRAFDMALRLKYAEISAEPELSTSNALKAAIDQTEAGGTVYLVMTYTTMLDVRKKLAKHAEIGRIEI